MPKTNTVRMYAIRRKRTVGNKVIDNDFTYGVVIPKDIVLRMKLHAHDKFKVTGDAEHNKLTLHLVK